MIVPHETLCEREVLDDEHEMLTVIPNEDAADQMLGAGKTKLDRLAERLGLSLEVLVVEDDDDMRWCIADLLNMSGIEATMAADGHTAMRLLECHSYTVVISDLRLPKASGMMVARTARACRKPPEIILMTAYPDWLATAEKEEFRVVHKPINLRTLAYLIADAITRHSNRQRTW